MLSSEVQKLEAENRILKESLEIAERKLGNGPERPMACERCKFYLQHYIRVNGQFTPTYYGHCIHGRIKSRKTDDSCKYFEIEKWNIKKFA